MPFTQLSRDAAGAGNDARTRDGSAELRGAAIAPVPSEAPGPRWPSGRRWRAALIAALIAGAAGAGVAVKRPSSSQASGSGSGFVATAAIRDLGGGVVDTGRIAARQLTQIKSKGGGEVLEVNAQEGQRVRKGQVLLRIDPTDLRREAERAVAEKMQQEAAVAYSRRQLARARQAQHLKIAPTAELDQFENDLAVNLGRLRAARAALWTARDRLDYTEIEAPFDGTVVERSVQPGEVGGPGMTA